MTKNKKIWITFFVISLILIANILVMFYFEPKNYDNPNLLDSLRTSLGFFAAVQILLPLILIPRPFNSSLLGGFLELNFLGYVVSFIINALIIYLISIILVTIYDFVKSRIKKYASNNINERKF